MGKRRLQPRDAVPSGTFALAGEGTDGASTLKCGPGASEATGAALAPTGSDDSDPGGDPWTVAATKAPEEEPAVSSADVPDGNTGVPESPDASTGTVPGAATNVDVKTATGTPDPSGSGEGGTSTTGSARAWAAAAGTGTRRDSPADP